MASGCRSYEWSWYVALSAVVYYCGCGAVYVIYLSQIENLNWSWLGLDWKSC